MEVRAVAKYIRVQPRKVRLVAAEVSGKPAQRMADVLRFHPSKGACVLRKVILSAIANAQENEGAAPEALVISEIRVDEGPRIKRMHARAMGRGNRILKRTSHITVVVEDVAPTAAVKPHGTKAKARPSFEKPKATKSKAKGETKVSEKDETPKDVVETTTTAPEPETAQEGVQPEESKE